MPDLSTDYLGLELRSPIAASSSPLTGHLDGLRDLEDAGAGAVRVVVNGKMQVLSVELDRAMIASLAGEGSDTDKQMIEERP